MTHMHFENRSKSRHFFYFIWFMYAVTYMTNSCFSAAMASIVASGDMTKSQTGLISALFYVVYAPLQVLGGVFADKYDPEKLIEIGLIGAGTANLLIFFNQSYRFMLIVWTLNALAQFAMWPSIFKIISSQLVAEDRKSSAYYISFSTTAGMLLSFLTAAVLPAWQYSFAISSAALFLFALGFYVAIKRAAPYMKQDDNAHTGTDDAAPVTEIGTNKLFIQSGFYFLIAVGFFYYLVYQSIQTLSATMLMESYKNISHSIGNMLNVMIICSGLICTVVVRSFVYPRIIKSAPTGILIMCVTAAFFTVPLLFSGKISAALLVISLCVACGATTVIWLFFSYCYLRFAKFGKSGTAAGAVNAAASLGIVASSFGITRVADSYNWETVSAVYILLLILSAVLCAAALPFWKRFKKKYHSHKETSVQYTNT